jgi:hypothetical protein
MRFVRLQCKPDSVVEDETVSRTVHGLESELLLLDLEAEHVIGVVVPMAGGLPQSRVVNVRGHNLKMTKPINNNLKMTNTIIIRPSPSHQNKLKSSSMFSFCQLKIGRISQF